MHRAGRTRRRDKDLAEAFDAVLERLDRSFDSQRRFVANASHELRTPLTINRTLIEVALDDPQANEAQSQLGTDALGRQPAPPAADRWTARRRQQRTAPDRLTQNLLDNPIRYNLREQGDVTVTMGTMVSHARLTSKTPACTSRSTPSPACSNPRADWPPPNAWSIPTPAPPVAGV